MRAIFILTFCILSVNLSAQNTLENAGFEEGLTPWIMGKYNGAEGVLSLEEETPILGQKSAAIKINNSNSQKEDLRLFQYMELHAGKVYEVYFQAKSFTSQEINISINNDLTTYWNEAISIQPDQQYYGPFLYESEDEDLFTSFGLELGKVENSIMIDSIIVNEISPTALEELLETKHKHFNHIYHNQHLLIELNQPVDNYGLLSINDISGQSIYARDLYIHQNEINIEGIKPGMYMFELNIDNQFVVKKVLLR